MKNVTYRQCELRRPRTGEVDVVWIPSSFAKRGGWLQVGEDERTWQVTAVYAGTNADDMLANRQNLSRFKFVLGE